MAYSLTKISKELGVSKSTVSLVLNGKAREARISGKSRRKFLSFAARLIMFRISMRKKSTVNS